MEPIFADDVSPVSDWFYKQIGGDVQHDFFAKIGSSYNRNWSKTGFVWNIGGLEGREWSDINEQV